MSKKNQSLKPLLPALGLVFGSGAGLLISILCSFSVWAGLVSGAAAGLLIGMIALSLSGN